MEIDYRNENFKKMKKDLKGGQRLKQAQVLPNLAAHRTEVATVLGY